ncbi:Calx-beta domain-containing protein [Microcystis sp. BLCC-F210]|uniref:Calx-beta domain-containing protein n=1 Tax=Microcystis sp. BLCC-F210 TaxID=3342751 RepID=UPI0035C93669
MNSSLLPIIPAVDDILFNFAQSDDFYANLATAFGTSYDVVKTTELRNQWQSRNFSQLPPIEVLSGEVLGTAKGAYAVSTNKIYLSESFLNVAASESLVKVILEEIGHYVDAQINPVDSAGDEGEYFAKVVLNQPLTEAEITRLKTENDQAVVVIDGQSVQIEQAITLVGSYNTSGLASDVQIVGNYAYVADYYSGLQIIDISNPAAPTLKGNYDTSGYAQDVQVVGNYAYVADDWSGLQIIDISNPVAPTLKGNYDTSGYANDVQVVGNYAYVADEDSGLLIIDISNPAAPTLKGNYDTSSYANDVQVVGNYAYVADSGSGLLIIDISNPTNPTLKGNYDTSGFAQDVQIVGNYAYVADWYSGLQIIDISNPATPTLKGHYDTSYAYDVQVVGNYAYVADEDSGLLIIDISNPAAPTLKGNYYTSGNAQDVQVVGNYAYVAGGVDGLQILDVSDFTNPSTSTITLAVSPTSVTEDGTTNLVYTFTRSGVTTNALTVNYTLGGTATLNTDYTRTGTTNTVTFAAGSSTATVTVDPTADTTVESDETVALTLATGTGYTVGTTTAVTGTITNDDTSITLAVSPTSVTEDGTANLVYTFTRSGVTTNPLTVNYTIGGTATNGTDYTSIPTSVTFAANSATATVTVDPTADTTVESDETVALTLATGTGYTVGTTTAVTGTITNDDTSITLAVSPTSVTEDGTANLVYTFTRSGVTTNPLTVNYTIGGTATNGTDYTSIPTSVTFAANSATATVTVDPTPDTTVENNETVALTLATGTGYTVGTPNTATGTINNDDTSVTLAVSPSSVTEDGTANLVYTFTRSGVTTNPLTVNYTIGGTATNGTDYTSIPTSVTFAANSATATVIVDPTPDTTVENNETVALTLATGTGYAVGTTTAVTGTITNDDTTNTNQALSFDGVDDYVTNDNLFPTVSGTFTMEFWVNPTATRDTTPEENSGISGGSGQRYAIFPTHGEASNLGFNHFGAGVSVGTNGISVFEHTAYYLPSLLVYDTSLSDWNHVAIVYSNNTPSLYLNGQFIKTGLTSTGIVHPSVVSLGGGDTGYGTFQGSLDEVRIWDTARTQTQIQNNLYSQLNGNEAGLIGHYNFNESSGNIAEDGTINNNDGEIVGPVRIDSSFTPIITLAVSPSSVIEDGTANLVYTFTRSGVTTNPLTVNYTIGGTATLNTDYTRTGTTNTVTFAANSATATVTVDPTPDTTVESDETVALTLATGTGYTVGTTTAVTGTITNDDVTLPSITLAVSPSSVTEDGTANLVYTFTRSGVTTNPLTVNYTIGGTATNGTDYTSIPTSVTFAANSSTATVTIDPTADTTVESDETVALTLATGTGYTVGTTTAVTGTITNDDVTLPSITLAVSPSSVTEDGTANLVYTFTRSGVTTNPLTVNYTLGGTATLNTDYTRTGTTNTVTFAANSSTATVTIDPTADTTVESDETVILTLATGTGYTVGTTTAVTGTITNDDVTLPSITLAVSPSSVTEDGTANLVYTFTRSGVTTNPLTVNYTIGGTATNGTDYTSIPTSVTFAANSATATVTVDPTADTTVESDETVALTLASGTGYTVGTTTAVTGTITNDDTSVTLAVSPSSVTEDGTANLVYTFTRSGVTTNALTVNYTLGGTATNGTDYTSIPTSVTFAANSATATVTVDPTADTTVESDETVALTLATGTGYTVGTTTPVTGTINNDDFSQLSINNITVVEGLDNNAILTVTVDNPNPQPITFNYTTAPINATADVDYTSKTGTITIAANTSTATISIPILNDNLNEANETFAINLSNPINATLTNNKGIVTISDTLTANVTTTLPANVENLTLTGSANINGTGNKLNNIITGNSGNNILNGATGIDTLIGGLGNDTYQIDTTTDTITENANQGTDTVQSSVTYTLGNNLENLTLTGTTNINGTGNTLNNIITGNSGNNILNGATGIDTLIGGLGNDTYQIDTTTDTITENANQGTDTVQSSVTYTLGNNLENLTLTGTTNINGTGNTLNNIITGNSGNNILNGATGIDTLIGGLGNDTYQIDTTTDTITENANQGTDTVQSSVTYTLGNNLENLTLTGTTNINGTGNTLNNIITGNSGNNILNGSDGNDTLIGGTGIDTLTGGAGGDQFTFNNRNEGIDTITDFLSSQGDKITVSAAGFGGGLAAGVAITAAQFVLGTTALNASNRLIYNTITGGLFFDGDGTGTLAAIQIATLSSKPTLTASDILVLV